VWSDCHYHIYPQCLINDTIFGKKDIEHTIYVISVKLYTRVFLILGGIQRSIINIHGCPCKVPVIIFEFKLNSNFLGKIFEKLSNIKFHKNPSSGSRVVPRERMDRHDGSKQ